MNIIIIVGMIKEGIEKEGVSRTFLCLDLAHQAVAASAGLLSRRPCPGSCLDRLLGHLLPECSVSHLLGNPGMFLFLFLGLSVPLLFLQSFLVSFS